MSAARLYLEEAGQGPGPAELDRRRKAAEPVETAWKNAVTKAGLNPDRVLNEYKAELKKSEALF